MSYNIVTVNVSQTAGATPSNLQQMSAIISHGATLQKNAHPVLITRNTEMTEQVQNAIGSLEAEQSSSGAEVTLRLPAGVVIDRDTDSEIDIIISGCAPSVWNGKYTATLTGQGTLKWTIAPSALAGKPTTLGLFALAASEELLTAVNTFFAQGNSVGTYLLELGYQGGKTTDQVAALKRYLEEPAKRFYAYLVPSHWDGDADFIALASLYTGNEAMQYFFTLTAAPADTNYRSPYASIKSVIAVCDDSGPLTNAAAAVMWNLVSASPSEINKVPPMAFRFLLAVNASQAKSSLLTTLVKNNINYVGTGAEGGIANTILVKGVTSDGNDMTYWYSVDWVQINVDRMLANAVINGSNNPINPLYYDQDGIDRLQMVAQGVFNTGIACGLVNGLTPVNAVPFKSYVTHHPDDYGTGRYAGLSASYTPMRGFVEIIFNINVTMQLS
ncbi:DUF3383 domain-containing protein [Erwiniaceae bacterium BAC15a-03b]|uniref:DUF3383 domain-containing protein n=1 Tax=Winslowiella arboricola TaxID=2978220 RepID=A0A9J6PWM7_9GAMM|nr:hypothetical protein [Winslowiella arboricola]MCU5774723.1 DUF3383 domain-containing protein [Winslowiella arboricola]MCU5780125.1 DUF3383 domain-containing protein [Winslowiella arboricola]